MDDNAVWIPIIAVICIFGLPVSAFIVFRVLAHRERMEMIRHGFVPQGGKTSPGPYAGTVSSRVDGPSEPSPDAAAMLRKGVVLAFIGMALTIGLSFIGYHEGNMTKVGDVLVREGAHWDFGPWLLGGLVPLFIGLAQVTTAFLTDPELFARYRSSNSPRGGPPPGAPPPGPYYGEPVSPPGDVAGGRSYTYRPGGTQELRPPTPPPTRRP